MDPESKVTIPVPMIFSAFPTNFSMQDTQVVVESKHFGAVSGRDTQTSSISVQQSSITNITSC